MDNIPNITDSSTVSGAGMKPAPSSGACENPRTVIRGSYSQDVDLEPKNEVGVHWVRASVKLSQLQEFVDWVCVWFGDDFTDHDYGLWWFDRSMVWTNKVSLNYHSEQERADRLTDGKITLEVPGSALDDLCPSDLVKFIWSLGYFTDDIGRLDLYYDDMERIIRPMNIEKLVCPLDDDGQRIRRDFAGFQAFDPKHPSGKDGIQYDAVCFGKRGNHGCGKYLRVYDKQLESKGKNPAIRWELELSGDKAKKAFQMFVAVSEAEFAKTIPSIIAGSINFIHRTGEKNIARLEQYDFWKKLLKRMGDDVPLRTVRKETSVEKKQFYLDKNMGASMITVRHAVGDKEFFQWLFKVLDDTGRLKKHHKALIAEYHKRLDTQPKFTVDDFSRFCLERGIVMEDECAGVQLKLFEDNKEYLHF